MKTIKDYKVISTNSDNTLEGKVNEGISQGWQPLGGLCISTKDNEINRTGLFSQAMVLFEKE